MHNLPGGVGPVVAADLAFDGDGGCAAFPAGDGSTFFASCFHDKWPNDCER